MKKPDRYSVIYIHINDIPQKIKSIEDLKLKWIITNDSYKDGMCKLFIFFDEEGKNNFLSGFYSRISGSVQMVLKMNDDKVIDDKEAIKRMKDYFSTEEETDSGF